MLSNACQYAIRAVLYLAQHSKPDNKISAINIAQELDVPKPFLAKLLKQLSSNDIISSTKGPGGGFYLSSSDKHNRLWDVILSIDGEYKFQQCFLGLAECNGINPCPFHHIIAPFKNALLESFKQKTIQQIVDEMQINHTLISLKGLSNI